MSKFKNILNIFFEKNVEPSTLQDNPGAGFLSLDQKMKLEAIIGCKIKNIDIFNQAITHRSYMHCVRKDMEIQSNERLEFLGDAILGMVVANFLFENNPDIPEGELTRLRSIYVNKIALSNAAKTLQLEKFLLLSHAALKTINTGGDSIIADAMEAVIAAIFLDSGYEYAKNFITNRLIPIVIEQENVENTNYKSILLENVQAEGKSSPVYKVIEESGPPHNKLFKIGVYVNDELIGVGEGKSKKHAEQEAAHEAMKTISL